MSNKIKLVIISPYEFPTLGKFLADGPRLRLLQLANSLNFPEFEVVFLSRSIGQSAGIQGHIRFDTWSTSKDLKGKIEGAKIVVASYAALGLNEMILKLLQPQQILVADAIVPILAENVSRESKQVIKVRALSNFLLRSNIILVSSSNLFHYYKSLVMQISSISIVESKFLIFPFVELDKPRLIQHQHSSKQLRLVHYGSVYPWFGVNELMEFLTDISPGDTDFQLTISGLYNPNFRSPEIEEINRKILQLTSNNKNVVFKPWLSVDSRWDFLSKFDFAIFFNN